MIRSLPLLAGLLALLPAGCASIGGAPIEEVATLVVGGGERHLRDPMRPLRGTTRVLVFALDGVGDDDLRRAISGGRLRNVSRLLGPPTGEPGVFAHGYAAPDVLSILPSNTVAAWVSLFTGRPPGETGVPGNEWFAREEMRFYAPVPGSFRSNDHAIRMYTQGLVGDAVRGPTLFEEVGVRSYVSLLPIHRGADLLHLPKLNTFGDLFAETVRGAVRGRPTSRSYSEMDRNSVRSLLAGLKEYGAPDLQVVYLPGVDLYTHHADPPLEAQQSYLAEVLDPLVGDVLDEYTRQGVLDRTFVVLVSDHGHTPVLGDDRHALSDEPATLLESAGFRVRPFSLDAPDDDFQAVIAYQGSMAFLYLADRSSCPQEGTRCDWRRSPRTERDVLPVVRAFHRANRTGEGQPELKGTLDLIFARPAARWWNRGPQPFQVWDGERLVPVADYLRRHPRPDLLRLGERMEALSAGPLGQRAGDVLLLTRAGSHLPIEERFYFGEEGYTSWHGSPSAQDSRIPLVVARPGMRSAEVRTLVRRALGTRPSQLHFAPLVHLLLRQP